MSRRYIVRAVSYTHLDVYKRQVVAGRADGKILRRIAFPSGKDAHPDEFLPRFYAVSYTHLDVYKRQVKEIAHDTAFNNQELFHLSAGERQDPQALPLRK